MKKQILRTLAVGAMVAGGFGASAALTPAQAHSCNNEPSDTNIVVNNTSVGYDNGSTGLTGVYVVCAYHPALAEAVEVGGGVHQPAANTYEVYYCLNGGGAATPGPSCQWVPYTIRP